MRLIIITFVCLFLNNKVYSQGARNCANISDEYSFLYGITNNLSTISLKNSMTGNFVPEGKEYQIAFVGEFYDPTVVFNFSADLGLKFSKLDLTKLDSVNYKSTILYFAPYVTYSPCIFNNIIGVRVFPTVFDLDIASNGNYERLGKASLSWGIGLALNKSFYRLWQRKPYLVPYHAQLFVDYMQTYAGNYFNRNYAHINGGSQITFPYNGIETRQRSIILGLRILYKFEN
jgi:hypothetical protein